MGAPCPHHCPSGSTGRGLGLVVLALAVAAAAGPVVRAADAAIATALEVLAIAGAVLGFAAVLAGTALIVRAVRRRPAARALTAAPRLSAVVLPAASDRPAIGSPVTDAEADTMIQAARADIAGALGTVLDDDADLARIAAARVVLPALPGTASAQVSDHSAARPPSSTAARPRCARNARRWQ